MIYIMTNCIAYVKCWYNRDMKLVTKDVDPLKTTLFGQEVILDEAGVNMTIVHKQARHVHLYSVVLV